MCVTTFQEQFLSNDANKQRLISILRKKLEGKNVIVKQAVEKADTLIVQSTIEIANSAQCVIMVGKDTDLLILLSALAPSSSSNIYFLKPGKGKLKDLCYSANNFKYPKHVKNNILFLHAFSGCDTTSSFLRQGKMKFVKLLEKNNKL